MVNVHKVGLFLMYAIKIICDNVWYYQRYYHLCIVKAIQLHITKKNWRVTQNKMNTTTTITRDTNYSFLKTTTKEDGTSFSRKLEQGTTDYSNAAMNFHMKGIALEIGNSLTK